MRVNGLDHVNIRTRDVEASARFYAEVLGLEIRNARMVGPDQGRWLYDHQGQAIIHLRLFDTPPGPTGTIDHVALSCQGLSEIVERLTARGAEFQVYDGIPGMTQLFTRDPHGVMLELNFTGD